MKHFIILLFCLTCFISHSKKNSSNLKNERNENTDRRGSVSEKILLKLHSERRNFYKPFNQQFVIRALRTHFEKLLKFKNSRYSLRDFLDAKPLILPLELIFAKWRYRDEMKT